LTVVMRIRAESDVVHAPPSAPGLPLLVEEPVLLVAVPLVPLDAEALPPPPLLLFPPEQATIATRYADAGKKNRSRPREAQR
jgi:hypothetical protein